MLARIQKSAKEKDQGFTLIELLVVIIIIGILAAIAIPVFLNQRQKGFKADMKSVAKNGATAVESYATETNGDYTGLTLANMATDGFHYDTSKQTVSLAVSASHYCIGVSDSRYTTADFYYHSATGKPVEAAAPPTVAGLACTTP
jgi:type IV pilus assembly protein PilA